MMRPVLDLPEDDTTGLLQTAERIDLPYVDHAFKAMTSPYLAIGMAPRMDGSMPSPRLCSD